MENCSLCALRSKACESLDDAAYDKLSDNHVAVGFSKGDNIIKQGMYSTNVAFLRKGIAKIHLAGPTHEQISKIVKAPTYLGLPTTFGDKVNQYSVSALAKCEVCFVDIETFKTILKQNETFSYEIIMELCRNELEYFRRCANRTQKQMCGNIADVLLDLSDRIFASDSFTLPLSQSEIGNLIDTSRESVSRLLSEFVRDGIIKMSGKQIQILDKNSLKLISQNG
jgi:CRP-like cAMP-binding protein